MTDDMTPTPGSNFCSGCGEPRAGDASFCPACGRAFADGGIPPRRYPSARSSVAIAAALVVLAATIAVLVSSRTDESVALIATTTSTVPVPTTQASTTTTEVSADLNERGLVEEYGRAVYKITTRGCKIEGTGTGFAIGENHIITNRHVVDSDTTPTVVGRDGSIYKGQVIGWRENPDIAVIRVDDGLDTYLEWADSDVLVEGERTVSMGYPLPDHDFSVAPGVVLSFDDEKGHRAAIRTDAQLDRGNSGGPMLLADGSVAGVVTFMDENPSGYQFVPIIIPANDLADKVEWIIEHPAQPTVDCDEVIEAYAEPEPTPTTTTAPRVQVAPAESFYTVILASMQQRNATYADALARAQQLANELGVDMYVLDSNHYSSLRPGYWVVYVGKMNRADAKDIAAFLRSYGIDAYAKPVSG